MERTSAILDHTGKPIKVSDLSRPVVASVTGLSKRWDEESVAAGLTPYRLATILRDAASGDASAYLTLAEEMEERDPHYASVLGTRKRAISGVSRTVESASDDAHDVKLADEVRGLLRDPEFGFAVDDLLDGLGKGYSSIEMNWDTSKTPWVPRTRTEKIDGHWQEVEGYAWRDPRFFEFNRNNTRKLCLKNDDGTTSPLPPYRFITHAPRLKSGAPIRGGLARLVAVAYMCKSYALTDWLAFAEVFGMPLRLGRYGSTAKEEDIRKLINAVANIGTDAAAVIPDSMRIDFEKSGTQSGGDKIFQGLAEYLDKLISKAVLGQVASTEGTPGQLGGNEAQDDVRQDILKADVKQLEYTLNRDLVKPYIDFNHGVQERYPAIQIQVLEPEDMAALVNALEKLVPLGLRVEKSVISDKLGLPDAADDAEVLQAASSPALPSGTDANRACPGCGQHHGTALNRADHQDEIDRFADAASDGWEEQLAPIIDPIQRLADESESYEAFEAGLPGLLEEMDSGELVRQLALETFKARGLGDATDRS